MARQYGNKVGVVPEPSSSSAPGAWVGPTEVSRQVGLNSWPADTDSLRSSFIGAYAFALTSGAALEAAASSTWLICSGQNVSRSQYPELFSLITTTYGPGDGLNTFTLPNPSNFRYMRTTTTSGLSLASLSGAAVLPTHTHTYGYRFCANGGGNNPGGSSTGCGSASPGFTSYEGGVNRGRHRQAYPLICTSDTASYPIGCVFPVLIPREPSVAASLIPSSYLICSGQQLSTTEFPLLYNTLSTQFGSGTGSFALPDLRGLFIENVNLSTVPQTSGVLPSGYILDEYARHRHQGTVAYTVFSQNSDSGINTTGGVGGDMVPPATTSAGVGEGLESRGKNFSTLLCVFGA